MLRGNEEDEFFGRRHTQSGATHSESAAPQINPATRERLSAELAEQARNGGAREKAELEQLTAAWLEMNYWRANSELAG